MNEKTAKEIADKIIGQVFGYQNPLSLDQIMQKFAFDIRLPQQVYDSTTGEETWSQSTNPTKFITLKNGIDNERFMNRPKRPINKIEDVLDAWNEINDMTTERQIDSINVAKFDNVYSSENVYYSQDIMGSKNILFSESLSPGCESIIAGKRSNSSSFCIRIEDSVQCSNSFNVSWSKGIVNSLFISDANSLQDCMFCSHTNSGQYLIANMQYTKEEYMRIRDMVIRWILTG